MVVSHPIECSIWGGGTCTFVDSEHRVYGIESARAGGKYRVTQEASNEIVELGEDKKVLLSGWIYEQNEKNMQAKITTKSLDDILKRPMPSVPKRMELLAATMARFSPLGYYLYISGDSWYYQEMLAASYINPRNERSEMNYILDLLVGAGYAIKRGRDIGLTGEGHVWVDKMKNPNIMSKQAFVAMWFDREMDAVYEEGIKLGIEDAGFEVVRIDKKEHINKIDDEIIAGIRRSRFVVADFTSDIIKGKDIAIARGGVYYEAGFAQGLNKPVFFTCREDCVDHLHFDTRQYNHIAWKGDDLAGFRKALSDRISAVVGDGPYRGSSDD